MSVRPYLAHCLLLQRKIYWRTAMPIHLRIVYGCFHTTAECHKKRPYVF